MRLKRKIEERKQQLARLESSILGYQHLEVDAYRAMEEKRKRLEEVQLELDRKTNILQGYIELEEELGYELTPPEETPDFFTKEILKYEGELAELVGNNRHYKVNRQYIVDGSKVKGEKFQSAYVKNILNGFNAYYQAKKKTVTNANLSKTKDLVEKSFEKFVKQGEVIGVTLSSEYLWYCIKIINNTSYLKAAKAEEKEKIKEEKRRLREQEKLLEEAERAKHQLEKERKEYELALAKSISEAEQEAIRAKLAEIDSREADIDYRITQQKAGWLYVITSKSLPNMCKIGCTRRLSPFERIKELSSASLPFPFVSKGIVFSEDVFALENAIHKRLDAYRVNKENLHKEFFEIDSTEVVKILREEFNCEVQFIKEEDEDE